MNIRTVLQDLCRKSWRTTVLGVSTPNKDPFIMNWYEYTYHFTGSVQEYPARGPEPLEDIVAFSTVQEYPARCPKPLEDIVAFRPHAYHTHHTTPKMQLIINHYFIFTRPSCRTPPASSLSASGNE